MLNRASESARRPGTTSTNGGGLLVRHVDLPSGADFTPLFKGLPYDRYQWPTGDVSSADRSTSAMPTAPKTPIGQVISASGLPGTRDGRIRASSFWSSALPRDLAPVLQPVGARLAPAG